MTSQDFDFRRVRRLDKFLLKENAGIALKWPGGKTWLANGLANIIRSELSDTGHYYEPFIGGGAVFFSLGQSRALISDVNSALMEFYEVLQRRPGELIKMVRAYSNNRDEYYKIRASSPKTALARAARFLYLNRTCWGGVYRVNRNGQFNVPFGNSGRPFCNDGIILDNSSKLANCKLETCDFEVILDRAGNGDAVYLDPPYSLGFGKDCFGRYDAAVFSWDDHMRLVRACERASNRGAFVCVSAAMDRVLLSCFEGWYFGSSCRRSLIGRTSESRIAVREAVIFSRPPLYLKSRAWKR